MITKTLLSLGSVLFFLLALSSCKSNNTHTIIKVTGIRKFEPFNDVEDAKEKLAKVGIGRLSEWEENGDGTISSKTPYYEFGYVSALDSVKNNLYYHLESGAYHFIGQLNLILNIHNPLEEEEAIKMFKVSLKRTYAQLNTAIPDGLLLSIDSLKHFSTEDSLSITAFKIEHSKFDILKLSIATK